MKTNYFDSGLWWGSRLPRWIFYFLSIALIVAGGIWLFPLASASSIAFFVSAIFFPPALILLPFFLPILYSIFTIAVFILIQSAAFCFNIFPEWPSEEAPIEDVGFWRGFQIGLLGALDKVGRSVLVSCIFLFTLPLTMISVPFIFFEFFSRFKPLTRLKSTYFGKKFSDVFEPWLDRLIGDGDKYPSKKEFNQAISEIKDLSGSLYKVVSDEDKKMMFDGPQKAKKIYFLLDSLKKYFETPLDQPDELWKKIKDMANNMPDVTDNFFSEVECCDFLFKEKFNINPEKKQALLDRLMTCPANKNPKKYSLLERAILKTGDYRLAWMLIKLDAHEEKSDNAFKQQFEQLMGTLFELYMLPANHANRDDFNNLFKALFERGFRLNPAADVHDTFLPSLLENDKILLEEKPFQKQEDKANPPHDPVNEDNVAGLDDIDDADGGVPKTLNQLMNFLYKKIDSNDSNDFFQPYKNIRPLLKLYKKMEDDRKTQGQSIEKKPPQ